MAPFIPAPGAALFELVFNLAGQEIENTIWCRSTTAWDAGFLDTVAGSLASWWATELAPVMSDDMVLIRVVGTAKNVQSGAQAIVTAGMPIAGDDPRAAAPNNVAFVVKFGTAFIGRSNRGRNYVTGYPSESWVGSSLVAGAANPTTAAYNALPAVLAGNTAEHVVASFQFNNVPRVTAQLTPVTSYVAVTPASRSQRRRNPGIGL
jgi:hypothetical protein